jgi:hypothetical protein
MEESQHVSKVSELVNAYRAENEVPVTSDDSYAAFEVGCRARKAP